MTQRFLPTLSRTFATASSLGMLRQLGASAPFGRFGLSRRRSRAPSFAAIAAASAALGAVAALLLAPSTGRDFRSRLGSVGKSTGGALGGQLGKLFGKQIGSHPVKTARIANTVQETLGSKNY
jgi:uncharacterized membrane protein YebE (DUF533 family)